MSKRTGLMVLLVYVGLRMVADSIFWRNISEYFSYAFELLFVGVVYFIAQSKITLLHRLTRVDAYLVPISIFCGALVFRCAGLAHVPVPFDFSSHEIVFLLLGVGPLLEELIFRMALWEAVQSLFANARLTLLITTALFAAGHLAAYAYVPDEFRGFIIYQTAYVFLLGAALGWRRLATGAVLPGLLLHVGFNLGFLLGAQI